jgi:hypothetical protein
VNIVVAWLVSTLVAVGQAPIAAPRDTDLETLAQWLTGEYTTSEQAESDRRANAAYRHDDVVLLIVPASVPGLPVPADARLLYLEQAVKGGEAAPYRQRVLAVFRAVDGALTTRTYRIVSPGDLAGAARDRARLERLRADRLAPEPGCDVTWTKADQTLYVGAGGRDRRCASASRGATYVTTQSSVTGDALIALDQGFDASGSQKWGPPPGVVGHVFRKRR